MNKHFVENNGTLSDEMYDKLGQAGLNKALVDSYLKGVREEVGFDAPAATLSDAEIAEVKGIANGCDCGIIQTLFYHLLRSLV